MADTVKDNGMNEQTGSILHKDKRKPLFQVLGAVIAAAAISYGLYYYFIGSCHVTTDNAYVDAEIAQITPSVGGTIESIAVKNTDVVKVGDILVVIDNKDTKLAFARAEAELAKAKAEFARAQLDFNRRKALSKSGSVSEEEVTTSDNTFQVAEALLNVAQVAKDQAALDLERTIIRSPVAGIVSKRQVQLGQRVSIGANLLSIVPFNELHVDANFKESQLKHVKIGQQVELTSDLYGDSVVYHGKVVGFSGGTGAAFSLIPAQNATGNWIKVVQRLPVRIELDPKELAKNPLMVGLSMYVFIDTSLAIQ